MTGSKVTSQMTDREWFREGVSLGLGAAASMVRGAHTLQDALNEIVAKQNQVDAKISGPGPRKMEPEDIDGHGRYMYPQDIGLSEGWVLS